MVLISLNELKLYSVLVKRASIKDPVAGVLNGLVISLSGDASELLGFIRSSFPSYTGHDLQHSWRILKRIEEVISKEALENLSSIEIFALIISAAFHDIGMIKTGIETTELRKTHHMISDEFLNVYLTGRLNAISEYVPRLIKCIGFIARAHGLSWEDMSSSEYFIRTERILEQPLRTKILAILLRVGDLLDLDSDRSCDPLRHHLPSYFDNGESKIHHERHKHVKHFFYDSSRIEVDVESFSKQEHSIWSEWLGYLKQDILHANTYIFKGDLGVFQLPELLFTVIKAPNANYELWPLRFEIDDKGRIWDVISQSVYTGKFDFLRELIQNSIDACLRWIYLHTDGVVEGSNPKHWSLAHYQPSIIVSYSKKNKLIEVLDNGIGMGKTSLTKFLFNVANSGYKLPAAHRHLPFPSIASFGIGFVSCLVRADTIIIKTKSREDKLEPGREVVLKTEAMDAYSEISDCNEGTRIKLFLKKEYSFEEIIKYIQNNFYSPSVPLLFFNSDIAVELIEQINNSEPLKFSLDRCYNLKDYEQLFNQIEEYYSKLNSEKQESNEKGISWKQFSRKIDSIKDVHSSYIKKPVFVLFDKLFDIIGIADSYNHRTRDSQNALLFVPVKFFDLDYGIEWFSIHAFVIQNGIHKKNLIRYTGRADKYQDAREIIVRSQEEWEDDEWEVDFGQNPDLNEEDEYSDVEFGNSEDENLNGFQEFISDVNHRANGNWFTKTQYTEHNRLKLSEKINGIMISDILENDLAKFSLLENQRAPAIPKDGEKVKEFVKNSEHDKIANLDSLLEGELKGDVFQDGIKLPIKCWAISPIGATYGRANFFGNSRFELNVTRNSINESPSLLTNWTSNVGRKIQKKILSEVISVFDKNGIDYKIDKLIMEKNMDGQDNIYEYSIPVLKSVIKSIKEKC